MYSTYHRSEKVALGFGQRIALGFALSLALTLVTMEWKWVLLPPEPLLPSLPWEDGLDPVPLITIEKKKAERPAEKKPMEKRSQGSIITPADDAEPIETASTVDLMAAASSDVPAKTPLPAPDPAPVTTATSFTLTPEVLPYMTDCTDDLDRHACTEERIQSHLQRRLRIPSNVRHEISTTVTFEIDAEGVIGKVHCAPKVPKNVEEEIARVIGSLPQFVPGMQGEHAVPVYYQIPLRLSRR